MLAKLLDAYSFLVLVAVVLSWVQVNPDNPVRKLTDATVEPVLERIRKVLPDFGGLDFSPLLLLVAIRFLSGLLRGGS